MSDKLAVLEGKDTYHHIVDKNYFHKGDRFRAQRVQKDITEVVYGTVTMDGLVVIQGSHGAHQNYINVHLDHRPDGYYTDPTLRGSLGVRVNESLHDCNGWVFYSTKEVLDAERAAKNIERLRVEHQEANKALDEVRGEYDAMRAQLRTLELRAVAARERADRAEKRLRAAGA